MSQRFAVTTITAVFMTLVMQPIAVSAQSVDRIRYVLTQALERNADP